MNVLTECLSQGTSPASVISFAKEYLKQEGFEELYYDKMLSPKENGKFFITHFQMYYLHLRRETQRQRFSRFGWHLPM